jgi:hypothetical protein
MVNVLGINVPDDKPALCFFFCTAGEENPFVPSIYVNVLAESCCVRG